MTSKERLLAVLHGKMPDCVPCSPDISNMVPARLTGKPFWEIYVYQNPPLWKAYIDAVKYFGFDGGIELSCPGQSGQSLEEMFTGSDENPWVNRIIKHCEDGSFITQRFNNKTGAWQEFVVKHTADNPPAAVKPEKLGLPQTPESWEEIKGIKQWPKGIKLWQLIHEEMGEHGIVGLGCGTTALLHSPEDIYSYYDNPEPWRQEAQQILKDVDKRMAIIARIEPKPDFIACGCSGSLVFQTPQILRELALPILKRVTELANELGIPTHVHSCGPEKELVKMAAEETKLTVIDPLESPPMGDCNLKELKQKFGGKIALKGNLHTTEVMLKGTVDDVVAASRKAIDDAGKNGGFILSTGDQCGRDTPDKNIFAMIETARTYGKY